MSESYEAALTLWPATTLTASVSRALLQAGVDLSCLGAKDVLYRTSDGEIALQLAFPDCRYGITDLEGVLATLRLAGVAYVAWDTKKGELAGVGRSFDPRDAVEREFTVLAGGEPVLIARDLDAFEHYGTAEALVQEIRRWLRLPLPERAEALSPTELTITVTHDDGVSDEFDSRRPITQRPATEIVREMQSIRKAEAEILEQRRRESEDGSEAERGRRALREQDALIAAGIDPDEVVRVWEGW